MTMPNNTVADAAPKNGGAGRRIAAATIIGVLLFSVLWYTVFSAVTAALVASGGAVVLVAGSAASDTFEIVFDMLANIILGILSPIGAFFAGIFSLFDW
jgi:hypothetical protein